MDKIKYWKKTLESELAQSNAMKRAQWAEDLITQKVNLLELSDLLKGNRKVALRFSWLLSDIGLKNPVYLHRFLNGFFRMRHEITAFDFEVQFATYWKIGGIPKAHEGEAINVLMELFQNPRTNITTKKRALKALNLVAQKYPELQNEIKMSLQRVNL